MDGGYIGKVLWVDLDAGQVKVEPLDPRLAQKFVGGYGLGAKVLFDRMRPGVDALGPENILGFVTGPLTGSPALFSSRYTVVGKSPLTGTWGDANSGGFFGPHLKFAGFDAVFFTGTSPRPVYLYIEDGRAELRDASALWGQDSAQTEDWLRAVHGEKTESACIGPSGERLALISCVMNNRGRAAGRSGLGAVMGAKRLKAIAVNGSTRVPLAQPERTRELQRKYAAGLSGALVDLFRDYGTPGVTADFAASGDSPVRNWAGSGPDEFPHAQAISGDSVIKYQTKKFFCWHCSMGCGGHLDVNEGPYAVKDAHKPEYETLASFGTLCLNENVESIIKANDVCNRFGLDTISAGATVAFAIECFENGFIGREDTGGLELRWGNAEAIVAITEKLARREGFGDVLADGVKVAAEKIGKGADRFAVHFGGQEPGMHDPRFQPGLAVAFLLDATPGRHTQGGTGGASNPPEGFDLSPIPKYQYAGKGESFRRLGAMTHIVNVIGMCSFGYACIEPQTVVEFLNAVTGWPVDFEWCFRTGERIGTIRHAFNLREGLNPLQFAVPGRAIGVPPLDKGPLKGVTVDLQTMLADYLRALDWDPVTAKPSARRLAELELDEVARAIL